METDYIGSIHPGNHLTCKPSPKKLDPDRGEFVYALTHELRNPLSTIKLAVEMLRSMTNNEDQEMFFDIISRGATRINDLLLDLITAFQAEEIKSEEYSIH